MVDQRGIDVVVALYGPDGKKLTEVDSPNGGQGPEPISWIAETAGAYRLEVRSLEKDAKAGKYEMKIETLRRADPQDNFRVRAEKSYLEGWVLETQGDKESLRKALDKFSAALSDWRAVGNRRQEAETLNSIGFVYDSLSEKQMALDYYNQALPIRREVGDRGGEATTLSNIGKVYDSQGKKQEALGYYNQALPISRQVGDRRGEAVTLNNIGLVYDDLGDKQRALEYYNQALTITRQVDDHGNEAATLNNIGRVYGSLGEKQKALAYYNQAMSVSRQLGARNGEAVMLHNIGKTYNDLGERQKALEYYLQALPILRQVGDRRGEATTLSNIGAVYDELGEMQKALDYHNQALPIRRQVGDRSGEATTLNSLGNTYNSLGEKQKALKYYNQALPLRQAVGDRSGEATTLHNIGSIYASLGEQQKALEYYNRVLPIWREVGGRGGEAATLHNIGKVYDALGKRQKALEYYNQALTIRRQVGDQSGEATTLLSIGMVYDSQGRKQKALEYYNQALTIMRRVSDRGNEAATLSHIGGVYGDLGNLNKARADIENALAIVETLRTKVARQELRSSYRASVQEIYASYIDLLMRMHKKNPAAGFDSGALQASERGRARGLLELLVESHANIRRGVAPNLLAQERAIQQELDAKAELLTQLVNSKQTAKQVAKTQKEVDDLTERYQEIEAQIREKSPRYAALTQPQPLSLAEIQKLLDPDTLLLEYALGTERSYLWAVMQGSYKSFELPASTKIETAARDLYQSLQSPGPTRKSRRAETRALPVYTAASAGQAEALARKLSVMLLSPVASMLGTKRLVIVPDGALQYLPFGALSDPARIAKWEPLILRHEMVSLPSASALAIQRRELGGRRPAPKSAVVIADPVFSNEDQRVKSAGSTSDIDRAVNSSAVVAGAAAKQGKSKSEEPLYQMAMARAVRDAGLRTTRGTLPRLPGTRIEAEEIVALAGADTSKIVVDFAANRATATSPDLNQYRYVHFATHGVLDSQNPELSALVLSLVDERGQAQDGYLRAHEIFNLNLPAEVVVLSACETGLGKDIHGEGLVGLTRGFMYAGAERIMVSLWSVNDRSTAELMKHFYRAMLKEGKRPAEAIREAQLEMFKQKRWHSPYYWAPFVLEGEWR